MEKNNLSFYFPKRVNIEVTNHCNIKCIICPHGHDLVEKKGYMSFEVFKKIIDELAGSQYEIPQISLFGIGESLLHPRFFDMAVYGKSKGFYQRLTTNGFFLTPGNAEKIISTKALDFIEISFDDKAEKYEKYKGGKIYDIVLDNIDNFILRNKDIQVLIKFIQYEMEDQFHIFEDIKQRFNRDNVTLVACEVSSWRGTMGMEFLSEQAREKIFAKIRQEPLKMKCRNGADMGMFSWDGSLRSCYMDYNNEKTFGNIKESSLLELFFSQKRIEFIDNIVSGNHQQNYICKDCLSPYNMNDKRILVASSGQNTETRGSHFNVVHKIV